MFSTPKRTKRSRSIEMGDTVLPNVASPPGSPTKKIRAYNSPPQAGPSTGKLGKPFVLAHGRTAKKKPSSREEQMDHVAYKLDTMALNDGKLPFPVPKHVPIQPKVPVFTRKCKPLTEADEKNWHLYSEEKRDDILSTLDFVDLDHLVDVDLITPKQRSVVIEERFGQGLDFFGLDRDGTRAMMRESKTLVSGSFPLPVAHPGRFPPNDLDFFTAKGNLGLVVAFLENQGYVITEDHADEGSDCTTINATEEEATGVCKTEGTTENSDDVIYVKDEDEDDPLPGLPDDEEEELPPADKAKGKEVSAMEDSAVPITDPFEARGKAISKVVRLVRTAGEIKRCINIIESGSHSPLVPVFLFHSTIVMTYIAHHGMVIPYVEGARISTGVINASFNNVTPKVLKALDKYRRRGYKMLSSASKLNKVHRCGQFPHCPLTVRTIGDTKGAYIPFEGFLDCKGEDIRTEHEGQGLLVWRLAGGQNCLKGTSDGQGFVMTKEGVYLNKL
ncbi:hypothetical protein CC1G_15463 [Coprinopsis cinerea okayama7|uniref:Uncharacterized protein n=1 Tax=Coprinopsis cinerea (strain Okayama-7 / 130 / ATCC MYA-4618 / FGSC 9003) TaxID=240176 RepID=D6RQQ5_COPC7|nr:hypothetical protein CC1G_15463 [Coprinopsis cinerea okayama7\|eukprot:XP_002910186.1 hypothetical protein CC1G_15463 [Coprinopsis cinerea okayama7\